METGGEGRARRFGIVERDDQDGLGVGKGTVPLVVVSLVADAEAAAVDGEEGGERDLRSLFIGARQEDTGLCLVRLRTFRPEDRVGSPDGQVWAAFIVLDDVGPAWRRVSGFLPVAHPEHRIQDALQAVHVAGIQQLGEKGRRLSENDLLVMVDFGAWVIPLRLLSLGEVGHGGLPSGAKHPGNISCNITTAISEQKVPAVKFGGAAAAQIQTMKQLTLG